jgi:DNA-directed RNA polymerase specialized sigma subunit
MINKDIINKAHLAVLESLDKNVSFLSPEQIISISFAAIYSEALIVDQHDDFPNANLQTRLTISGIRAIREAQAGKTDRSLLIARIEALDTQEKTLYSLRYEHGMSDWQIAKILNISENEVVSIMLSALLKLTGVVRE